MYATLKSFLERTTFLGSLARRRRHKRFEKKYSEWKKKGSALPIPHFGKQMVLAEYADGSPRQSLLKPEPTEAIWLMQCLIDSKKYSQLS